MTDQGTPSFDLLVNIASYTDDELKALSDTLQQEELEVSKRRRILHGELDILRAEMVRRLRDKHQSGEVLFGEGDVEKLSRILTSRGVPNDDV
jgi:hypothetical protein